MAPNIPDTYLWLGLGLSLFLLTHHASSSLHSLKRLTLIHHPSPPPPSSHLNPNATPSPTPQESAIKTPSLLALATSHNTDIRHAATKLLCERFAAHAPAGRKLVRDLESGDEGRARRARRAVGLLREVGVLGAGTAAHYARDAYGYGAATASGGGLRLGDGSWDLTGGGAWDEEVVLREPRPSLGVLADEEEEREARRRRREAVVVHEGEGRVGRGDVWMRDREGVMGMDFEGEGGGDVQVEVGELVIDGVVF